VRPPAHGGANNERAVIRVVHPAWVARFDLRPDYGPRETSADTPVQGPGPAKLVGSGVSGGGEGETSPARRKERPGGSPGLPAGERGCGAKRFGAVVSEIVDVGVKCGPPPNEAGLV